MLSNPPYFEKSLLIDIDGTVFLHSTETPLNGAVEWVNKKYDEGYGIYFFTSRLEIDREETERALKANGFKYHTVIMGKPYAGKTYHLDDREFKSILVPRNMGVTVVDQLD